MDIPLSSLPDTFYALDIHFARLMEKLSGGPNPSLLLAAALASNAVQEGNICVDLAGYAGTAMTFSDPPCPAARWPLLDPWIAALRATPVVGTNDERRPLVLCDTRLYLYRYRDYEQRFVAALRTRSASEPPPFDTAKTAAALARLFPESPDGVNEHKLAASIALIKNCCVISGGPGTGKTTTVIRIAALLALLAAPKKLRMALAAPTGKAAARLEESIAGRLPSLTYPADVAAMIPTTATTIHLLLGTIPDSPYFRHTSDNPLPYDVVIIDEASMVDLPLMVKLLDAIPPESRVLLLGDKDQLASVEAGALLGDLCDRGKVHGYSPALCAAVKKIMPEFSASGTPEPPLADIMVTLEKNYRFDASSGIGAVSRAVNGGDADTALSLLKSSGDTGCTLWVPRSYEALRKRLRDLATGELTEFMHVNGPREALELFARSRILCAVRNGPLGVLAVNGMVENVLVKNSLIEADTLHYKGRPIIITRNDYAVDLYNGDTGIVMPDNGGGLKAFFLRKRSTLIAVPLHRLPPHETAFALTLHKAQGSEFERTVIILPSRHSPIVTRELLYTGITRSRRRCELWCAEEIVRLAVTTRTRRTSGIREALWE